MRWIRSALAALVLLPAIAIAQDSGVMIGTEALGAAVQTLEGKPANLSQHFGKQPVVIYFWATWCPVCKELTPALDALSKKYAGKVTFLNVAVSVNQSPALIRRYVAARKMGGIQYYDFKGEATGAYDVPATSYVVVIDQGREVVFSSVGGDKGPKIEAVLRGLLR